MRYDPTICKSRISRQNSVKRRCGTSHARSVIGRCTKSSSTGVIIILVSSSTVGSEYCLQKQQRADGQRGKGCRTAVVLELVTGPSPQNDAALHALPRKRFFRCHST